MDKTTVRFEIHLRVNILIIGAKSSAINVIKRCVNKKFKFK